MQTSWGASGAKYLNMSDFTQEHILESELEVTNSLGLHARVAARIVEAVKGFQCRMVMSKDGQEAEAASVLELLTLDAPQGSQIRVRCRGPEAPQAMEAVKELFNTGPGETA